MGRTFGRRRSRLFRAVHDYGFLLAGGVGVGVFVALAMPEHRVTAILAGAALGLLAALACTSGTATTERLRRHYSLHGARVASLTLDEATAEFGALSADPKRAEVQPATAPLPAAPAWLGPITRDFLDHFDTVTVASGGHGPCVGRDWLGSSTCRQGAYCIGDDGEGGDLVVAEGSDVVSNTGDPCHPLELPSVYHFLLLWIADWPTLPAEEPSGAEGADHDG